MSIYLLTFGLGFLFFAWSWFLVKVVFIPLWWLESKEEENEMWEKYGEEYVECQERTKMFIPGVV
jgi:protein-S-isoprenylcysteine O-methyltransferase Ste14